MLKFGKGLILIACCAVVVACGFKLRGSYQLPPQLQQLQLLAATSALKQELELLLGNNQVNISNNGDYALKLFDVEHQRRVIAIDSAGNPMEYELSATVNYLLRAAKLDYQSAVEKVRVTRIQSYSGALALSADVERANIKRQMERELAARIVQQLSSASFANLPK